MTYTWEETAKGGRLVHVDPKTIDIDTVFGVEEHIELIVPVISGILSEPVREDSDTRPDNAKESRAVLAEKKDVVLDSTVKRRVVVLVAGCWVNHDDVVLVVLVKMRDERTELLHGVALWVGGEDEATVHIVDIGPHSLEGNAGLTVIVDDFGDLESILVTVSALMETEAPVLQILATLRWRILPA